MEISYLMKFKPSL